MDRTIGIDNAALHDFGHAVLGSTEYHRIVADEKDGRACVRGLDFDFSSGGKLFDKGVKLFNESAHAFLPAYKLSGSSFRSVDFPCAVFQFPLIGMGYLGECDPCEILTLGRFSLGNGMDEPAEEVLFFNIHWRAYPSCG
ncbi:hypothetical protein [Solemya velesiana gill symbiont]|uniref:Uncharacterized protein n=1 Tax=Solemya velesiana gill symbiont TaxID=1918948 RepID=A0A1T2KT75_9GAMM|nr:hypothetical protein [Solemya velesiana gill symbiont]OOZ36057.1 hypothetical protein BOW51_09030 [Solemya velesiana gill symbiont]